MTQSSDSALVHFPVALFIPIMGTAAWALAWKRAAQLHPAVPAEIALAIGLWASAALLLFAGIYLLKWLKHAPAVALEALHPVKSNFFAAFTIGLMLLGAFWADQLPQGAEVLWGVGALLHLIVTLKIVSGWIFSEDLHIHHASPAWFIPVVGNVVAPIGGVSFVPIELCWLFFGIGLLFWLLILVIVLVRLFFHEALPVGLRPSLFILLAPPSIGLISWSRLHPQINEVSHVLFGVAVFMALLLASQTRRFVSLPFTLGSWSYSFPLAGFTVATLIMAEGTGFKPYHHLSLLMLTLTSLVLLWLWFNTAKAAWQRQICVPG